MRSKELSPMVSVIMITYGHEQYIQEAIEGVLMQECDFDVELIIADDHSPDGTEKVVKQIIKSHPKGIWIEYTRHEVNKGMNSNFIWAVKQARGKYIALCEGDDYWIDPLKLHKQVNFLEENDKYSICYHAVQVSSGIKIKNITNNKNHSFNFKDSLKGKQGATLSMVFLKKDLENYKIFADLIIGDWPLELYLLREKVGYFLGKTMGVYRKNSTGITISAGFHKLSIDNKIKFISIIFSEVSVLKKILLCYYMGIYNLKKFKYTLQ